MTSQAGNIYDLCYYDFKKVILLCKMLFWLQTGNLIVKNVLVS